MSGPQVGDHVPRFIRLTTESRDGERFSHLVNPLAISRMNPYKDKCIVALSDQNEFELWALETQDDVEDMMREVGCIISAGRQTAT